MKYSSLLFIAIIAVPALSQNDSLKQWNLSAYGELYYSFDFSNPQNHEKPDFLYNHKRHNELNANLLLFRAASSSVHYRVHLGFMAGNYAQYNLNAEPIWAQFIHEANVGIRISKKQNVWIDAGIMPSHIGFESAVSADCWTLTRSLLAENSPYYETGVKLSFSSKNERWHLAVLYLNGWQKISKPDFMQTPSWGTQFSYRLSEKLLLNYSTFLGTDTPDSMRAFRQYHNFYLRYQPTHQSGVIAGFDIGRDKFNPTTYGTWYSPVLIIRQSLGGKTAIAVRGEFYSDPREIIISTGTANGFQTFGLSSNIDFTLNPAIQWRIEGKWYHSKDKIFSNANNNYSLTTNITFKL